MFKPTTKPWIAFLVVAFLAIPASIYAAQPEGAKLSESLSAQRLNSLVGSKSLLSFTHRLLGAGTLRIDSLQASVRSTTLEGSGKSFVDEESIYLGKGTLLLRRGIPKNKQDLRKVRVALSAQLKASKKGAAYLRLHFSRARGAGRVFEITIPLNARVGEVRNVSLRALDSKLCGFDKLQGSHIHAQDADPQAATLAATRPQTSAAQLKIFTVTTDCDFECFSKLGQSSANNKVAEFFNAASTIYGDDLGFGFRIVSQVARTSSSTYPTSTTNSESLLDLFVARAPSLTSADFKHLITGKTMQENVVGLSFVGVACRQPSFSLGYSQHVSTLLTPIIIAHEIGHNFNAFHDPSDSGIMAAQLSSPFPTGFSQFSKNEMSSYVNSLGGAACFELDSGSSSSASSSSSSSSSQSSNSSSSSSSSNSGGGGTDAGDSFQAGLTTKLRGTTFSAALTQPQGSNCSVSLRVSRNESGLSTAAAIVFSSAISNTEKINLSAVSMPKVKVNKAGKKALVWFQVGSSCTEGDSESEARTLNLAIAPEKATRKITLKNTKAWVNLLKNSLRRK